MSPPSPDPSFHTPRSVHAFEQMGAGLVDLAASLASYFQALVDQGFTREEALQVVLSWQRCFFLNIRGSRDPDTP